MKVNPLPGRKRAGTISTRASLRITTASPAETQRLGRLIGKQAEPGDVYLLTGDLGAGKTCLSHGIARGLGIKGYVMSPSFVIVREYRTGRLPLFHLDFYRLENQQEICGLGLDEYFYGPGVTVVEWAERATGLLPPGHLSIKIEIAPDNVRHFHFAATGEKHQRIIECLRSSNCRVG
ncbi:MAG: tRNA (adenosine(37)-N6)-threonylcarbamoyltransferase complex ATPase subunit type 1 TsaE [Chloroflexi bacterium]|nr:tRNA (adenosine(37)-N6)-threonylcarbamoyltransferase complex ATPase subunit type 1 TsaE [Chloroflexota bacterium]